MIKAIGRVRPLLQFPEWLDREDALRKSLAEQVQARTMSLLERNVQIQKLHSQFLDEERSRLSTAPADAGKPPAAVTQWRQSNPEGGAGSEATPRPVIEKCDFRRLPGGTHRSESMMIDSEGQKACSQAATRFR